VTCERCQASDAIVTYHSFTLTFCLCPKCDHSWSIKREFPGTTPKAPTSG
jgi:hypothetical protein